MKRVAVEGIIAAYVLMLAGGASGATIGYWTFDDAAPSNVPPDSLFYMFTNTNVRASATTKGAGAQKPYCDDDRDGLRVIAGVAGPVTNSHNRASARFANRDVPGSTSSAYGSLASVPDSDPLTRPRDFTAECFIKVNHDVDYPTIMGKQRSDAGGTSWQMDINGNGTLRCRVDSQTLGTGSGNPGFNQGFTTSSNLQDGQWHHVAITYDDTTQTLDVFVDYVDVGGGTTVNPIAYDDQPLVFGAGAGRALDGWIDEARLSDTVLPPAEFLRFDTGSAPATIGYWTFDDGTAPNAAATLLSEINSPTVNATGQGYGTGSAPTFASPLPGAVITDGPDGARLNNNSASLKFTNVDLPGIDSSKNGSMVTVPDSDPLTRPRDFTIEAFVKIDRHVRWPQIISKQRAANKPTWGMDMSSTPFLRCRYDTEPLGAFNQNFSTVTDLEDGNWHHVAMTYDDNTLACDLYMDYVDVGGGRVAGHIVYAGHDLVMGNLGGNNAIDGWMDEVRFSDHVRHPEEFMRAIVPDAGTLFLVR
jgi:hypothetical protein